MQSSGMYRLSMLKVGLYRTGISRVFNILTFLFLQTEVSTHLTLRSVDLCPTRHCISYQPRNPPLHRLARYGLSAQNEYQLTHHTKQLHAPQIITRQLFYYKLLQFFANPFVLRTRHFIYKNYCLKISLKLAD